MSLSSAGQLPVEIVRQILEYAASDFMLDAAAWVADMLLLNRAARSWLTPIVYCVFIVRLPDELDSTHSKSFTCFLNMLIHPDGFPHRAHIRHLVFRVRDERTEFTTPLEDLFNDAPDAAVATRECHCGFRVPERRRQCPRMRLPAATGPSRLSSYHPHRKR